MPRCRTKPSSRGTEQASLDFNQPRVDTNKSRPLPEPEQAAKRAIARRAKPSAVPDHVKLTLTLDVPRGPAEGLSSRAIREGKNLEGVVMDILKGATR
jgi:hypothetical protein